MMRLFAILLCLAVAQEEEADKFDEGSPEMVDGEEDPDDFGNAPPRPGGKKGKGKKGKRGKKGKYMPEPDPNEKSEEEMMAEYRAEQEQKRADAIVRAGKEVEYLAQLAADPEIKDLGDGLLYKVLKKGTGTVHPMKGTKCKVHYEGVHLVNFMEGNETTFVTTRFSYVNITTKHKKKPKYVQNKATTMKPNLAPDHFRPLKSWVKMLTSMVEGEIVEFYLPSKHGYDPHDDGQMSRTPGGYAIMFRVELVEIGVGKHDRHTEL